MRKPNPIRSRPRPSEEGFILLAVIFLLALFALSVAIAAPRIAKQIQIDRERETMERGKQYERAIQLYYRKFQAYPPSLDALVKTSEIRFLRKKYTDPMTGKDDWKPILFGQNKTPTAMGFFGQPLAGGASTMAGTGPSGGNGVAGASPIGGSSLFDSGSSGTGASAPAAPGAPGGTTGGATSPTSPMSGTGSTTSGGSSAAGGSSASGTGTGLSGPTFGGAGIIGFEPGSPKQSILVYKKKNHYNQWEFVYDPLADQSTMSGNTGAIGQPASSTSSPIGSSPSGSPGSSGSPGIGPSPSPGPSSPPTTPAPQP